ncbi:MarR family winged helix-turn-helix transcriptional regulator [Granulicella tundricola]|uniref:Transcriptional regulator, MarR family n=1 Tax=Granulicella tundricola (strain ATCC BAA-1859 / DSM 23138 / MP5ACTX9) TaxID=1198114 RepID=E8WZE0_GRATM|nr:MarR family winged helix-turn-helix transcriptional regulator [Granulicella tundricola]ADW68828.1 transcriptional regulator, MarR family [Granulicella tundricola MP5ACTX9]
MKSQTNPGDLGCTCYRLRQSARLTTRLYDRHLAPSGLNIGQFGILATLAAMHGQTISNLAAVLQLDRTTLTRNLLPLQKLGLVEVEPGPDKRARSLSLTQPGREALAQAKPLWQAAQQALEQQLGKPESRHLNQTLDRTLSRLALQEGPQHHA